MLTCTLSGLSKLAGLPQVKLSWMAFGGPPALQARSPRPRRDHRRHLPLGQHGRRNWRCRVLLGAGAALRAQIRDRVRANRAALDAALAGTALRALPAEGGWYATVRLPALRSEEAWALALLREDHVLVHPGYFFDLPGGCLLVLSLLPPPAVFAEAVARLVARVAAVVAEGA